MKRIAIALLIVTMSASAVFARSRVRIDFDENQSFTGLSTFQWVGTDEGVAVRLPFASPFLEGRVREAVNRELYVKGIQEVAGGPADMLIGYHVVVKQVTGRPLIDRTYEPGYHSYGQPGYYGHSYSSIHGYGYQRYGYPHYRYVREYLKVTLVLDIFDAETGELIWRGWANNDLASHPEPRDVKKFADRGVHKMLKQFPPVGPNK